MSGSSGDPLVGKVLAERFEILERVGDGGTGVVYKARQLSVDRVIAVKVLGAHVSTDPQWMKRFQNEARAASRLEHPNTVRVIDFGQTREGLLYIAMEYLHGRSLRQEIARAGRMPPERVLSIVAQICASLAEAHNQGIIHRDIKPDNVQLTDLKGSSDFVKVLDFSVAKLDTPDAQLTRAGVVFGTPAYMSPEQGRGAPLDRRSDLYAVGVVAYEMLAGVPPFDHNIPTEVVMMHLRNPPPPLTGVPSPVARLVMQALEKDASRRQQTAEQLEQQCKELLTQLSGPSHPASAPPHAPPPVAAPLGAPPPLATGPRRTMALDDPPPAVGGGHPGGTLLLSDSPRPAALGAGPGPRGAFEVDARRGVQLPPGAAPAAPTGPLFWLAWVVLGLGAGLGYHFLQWMR